MTRLLDGVFSEGQETMSMLSRDSRFTVELALRIRGEKGVERALDALHREFFPLVTPNEPTLIDGDADPFIPQGLKVDSHRKCGVINPLRITLYTADVQNAGFVNGADLGRELESRPVLNACVLDFLLDNPHLIPESWKGRLVVFWGTVYLDSSCSRVARYLGQFGGQWRWGCVGIYDDLDNRFSVTVSVS